MLKLVQYLTLIGLCGCASKLLTSREADQLEFSKDYDKVVKITEISPPKAAEPVTKQHKKSRHHKATKEVKVTKTQPGARQPNIEDREGMVGRRPEVDPFRVGEKLTFNLSYFKMNAGEMTLSVSPHLEVNGRKAYHFEFGAKSTSVFSVFYAVDDHAETFMDFSDLIPSTYAIHVKESKQLREVRAFWDYTTHKAHTWDKKVTKEKGVHEENLEWDLEPYAQNVFSAIYYMRVFKMYPGKKLAFWVADNGKNYLFRGEVLRREKLETDLGELDTLVIQPRFELDGVFAPVGDILFWVTDDDRKFLVRIESKIKIGTIVGKIKSIEKGQ